jgi:hypothetical protein
MAPSARQRVLACSAAPDQPGRGPEEPPSQDRRAPPGPRLQRLLRLPVLPPLFLFKQFGDLERVMLRRGSRPSIKFWRPVLLLVIQRYRGRDIPKYFRGGSTFALPILLRLLERKGFRQATRDGTLGARFCPETPCNRLPAVVASTRPFAIAPGHWNGRQPSGPWQ